MKNLALYFSILILAALAIGADARHGKVAAANDKCDGVLYDLMPCTDYLLDGSTETKPAKECCTGLVLALKLGDDCICDAIKQGPSLGLSLNLTRVTALPTACGMHITNPDCHLAPPPGTPPPTPSPAPTPAPPPSTPTPPPKTPPSTPAPPPKTPPSTPAPPPSTPAPPPSTSKSAPIVFQAAAPAPSAAEAFTASFTVSVAAIVTLFAALLNW